MITYSLDKIRIVLGDSSCPLAKRCPGYDGESDSCVSYRGRKDVGGERAECYNFFKPQIRAQKEGLISRLAGAITRGLTEIGGLEKEELK